MLEPGLMITVAARSSGPGAVHPWMKVPAITASSSAATTTAHLARRCFGCVPGRFATINLFHFRRQFPHVLE